MTEMNGKCAIWGTPAMISNDSGPPEYFSPRAGGKYRLGTAYNYNFSHMSVDFKPKLTSWLIEKRLSGEVSPEFVLACDFNKQIEDRNWISVSEKINRFFLYCSFKKIRPGDSVYDFKKDTNGKIIGLLSDEIYAWIESKDYTEFLFFRDLLKELNFTKDLNRPNGDGEVVSLTSKGFARLDELERTNINSKQAFVAMWFDESIKDLYEKAIRPAIEEAEMPSGVKFTAVRIDNKEHNNKIDDEIIAEIRRSRFVIADFTSAIVNHDRKDQAISRGGVYYEAGFAQGLGLPVIWTCKTGFESLIHFDIRQYNTIFWQDYDDLKRRLKARIEATIT
jgi:nucleoside 2-deoxyribosyltransferase